MRFYPSHILKNKPKRRASIQHKKLVSSPERSSKILAPGTRAPNFTLLSTPDQKVSLADFRGRPLILIFYPADWSPVCTDELSLYNQLLPELQHYNNPEVIGISADGIWCHLAFSKDRNLKFPLLSDFEPKGDVSRKYGVYQNDVGEASRALFVIDEHGVIRWSYLSPVGVNPGADGILNALEQIYPDIKKVA
jgi:peroxiredoxin